jgi:protein phosphatase
MMAAVPFIPFFALKDFGQMLVFGGAYLTLYLVAVRRPPQLVLFVGTVALGIAILVVGALPANVQERVPLLPTLATPVQAVLPDRIKQRFHLWLDGFDPPATDTEWWQKDYEDALARNPRMKELAESSPAMSKTVNVDVWFDRIAFQPAQATFGIASGGMTGRGLGLGFSEVIPVADSDYIYAAIGEELGLAGGAIIFIALIVFVNSGVRIAIDARDMFTKLSAAGLTAFIGLASPRQHRRHDARTAYDRHHLAVCQPRRILAHHEFRDARHVDGFLAPQRARRASRGFGRTRPCESSRRQRTPISRSGGSRMSEPTHNSASAASQSTPFIVEVAAITDRGLSEKRPVNEDSFLSDTERRIFAVADGVGGAQSGEVASQTAIETLDEAFRHHKHGEDAEDLMEIAFQRANIAIHQMSREHHRLAMMATTIVALHLDDTTAIIGHVGDSRLYRLTPDGQLRRETVDHSVVEEEIRAGRLTPDEAQHHPNRNIISRALGAEISVEAEMQKIELAANTTFLLCSDGITRHIPDDELRDILTAQPDIHRVCEEFKKRCFERGAEDNLTAVVIRTRAHGEPHSFATSALDPEQTIAYERTRAAYATGDLSRAFANFNHTNAPLTTASESIGSQPTYPLQGSATTRLEVPTPAPDNDALLDLGDAEPRIDSVDRDAKSSNGGAVVRNSRAKFLIPLAVILFVAIAVAAGFYANSFLYQRPQIATTPAVEQNITSVPTPLPTSPPGDSATTCSVKLCRASRGGR